ncbi:MAG TPA: response regulator [Terriglobia bacterium]|nr:response regulator [Terriglobia bacterium]
MSKDRRGEGSQQSFKPRLLLVDEDFDDLRRYSNILSQAGYEVRSFACYDAAAACLALEAFDLIIVSQGSSNFEGRRVLARAMEKDRRTPVLVLTRSVEMPCYLEAMQLGARDYMEKPLLPSEIGRLAAKYVPTRLGAA